MRFKELGPAKEIKQLRLSARKSEEALCWVVGWSDDPGQPLCPAFAQPVEDSGQGLAYLIYGGNWGIRLKPVNLEENWDLYSSKQWGEAFLLIGDPRSIVYED